MLRDLKTLRGFSLKSSDAEIGNVRDLFFDDLHSTTPYLVVDRGSWLIDKMVLIAPKFLNPPDDASRTIRVHLTRNKIEDSPSIERNKPVTRQHEAEFLSYYGMSYYWPETMVGGSAPGLDSTIIPPADKPNLGKRTGDPNLHSIRDLIDFHIRVSDGELDRVQDFILHDDDWTIRYLIVNTANWWPGGLVLLSPKWIRHLDRRSREVRLALPRETLRKAPLYDPLSPITCDYEERACVLPATPESTGH